MIRTAQSARVYQSRGPDINILEFGYAVRVLSYARSYRHLNRTGLTEVCRSAETRLNFRNLALKQAANEFNVNRVFTVRRIIYFTRVYDIHHPLGR